MNEVKSPLMSKTIWINLMMAMAAVLSNWWPELAEVMSEANLVMIFSVVNIVLRAVTKSGIEFK